jgi:hypothetical protein
VEDIFSAFKMELGRDLQKNRYKLIGDVKAGIGFRAFP